MNCDKEVLVGEATAAYVALLDRDGSPVLADPALRAQLLHQAESVLLTVGAEVQVVDGTPSADTSQQIGSQRARSAIHPTQSLRAGSLMFEALLPVLTRYSATPAVAVATALEREIRIRLAVGSVPYVDYLLATLLSSQHAERTTIARDVHDRLAHGMGVALQQLELFDYYRTFDSELAETHLATARASVAGSLDSARRLSADLWVRMPEGSLRDALEAYLDIAVQDGTSTAVVQRGETPRLGAEVLEELYLLLREVLRNALLHASPTSVEVTLINEGELFRAVIVDDGCGFDVEAVTSTKTVGGLASIRERAEVLGGRALVTSETGAGTTVEVQFPVGTP